MKLELSIRASKLKNVAGIFKGISDPFAIVTRLSVNDGEKPEVLGKTEVVKNNLSPEWVKVFTLQYDLGTPSKIAINLFDEVPNKKDIDMGGAVFDVGELLGARGNTQRKRLRKGGLLIATVRKSEGTGVFRFKLKGEDLKNVEGYFGTSDPFFELCRKVSSTGGQNWNSVYRSEDIRNNLNPVWDEGTIGLSVLCAGNLDAPIALEVFDHEKSGKHVMMGHLETSVNALVEVAKTGCKEPMPLTLHGEITGNLYVEKAEISGLDATVVSAPPTAQMAAASISQPGATDIPVVVGTTPATSAAGDVVPVPPPGASRGISAPPPPVSSATFVDYISGGCELNVVVAIDFTGSNGDPRKPGTLHYHDAHSRNQYEQAIAAIVSILLQYDSDKKVPVLGFGAKYGGVVRHCFQCGPTPEANGLHGTMDAYYATFSSGLTMSRPTVFTEVLETAAQKADTALDDAIKRGSQAYTILLILTDGAVSDKNATAACLNKISKSPLSVVIVGVGNADFSAMRFLDDYANSSEARDIAQFVAFNQHAGSSQSLTKATLEEIPDQLVQFFQSKGIEPLPPPIIDSDEDDMASAGPEDEAEEPDIDFDLEKDDVVVTGGGNASASGFDAMASSGRDASEAEIHFDIEEDGVSV